MIRMRVLGTRWLPGGTCFVAEYTLSWNSVGVDSTARGGLDGRVEAVGFTRSGPAALPPLRASTELDTVSTDPLGRLADSFRACMGGREGSTGQCALRAFLQYKTKHKGQQF